MDFANINKQFMLISKDKYEIVDMKEADFIPTITNVLICFVVNTDIDKSNFLKEKYDECCEEYLSFVKQFEQYRIYTYEFMLLSKEEVKRDYDGNFYYAMH